jgi:hypothetical protein
MEKRLKEVRRFLKILFSEENCQVIVEWPGDRRFRHPETFRFEV